MQYMTIKGFGDLPPLGVITVDETCWYFYWLLDDEWSLLELEVILNVDVRQFSRRVTAFVTKAEEVDDLLAS
jgi:hypothetical protein